MVPSRVGVDLIDAASVPVVGSEGGEIAIRLGAPASILAAPGESSEAGEILCPVCGSVMCDEAIEQRIGVVEVVVFEDRWLVRDFVGRHRVQGN